MESILEPWKLEILREFRIWIEKFTRVTTSRSTEYVTDIKKLYCDDFKMNSRNTKILVACLSLNNFMVASSPGSVHVAALK